MIEDGVQGDIQDSLKFMHIMNEIDLYTIYQDYGWCKDTSIVILQFQTSIVMRLEVGFEGTKSI